MSRKIQTCDDETHRVAKIKLFEMPLPVTRNSSSDREHRYDPKKRRKIITKKKKKSTQENRGKQVVKKKKVIRRKVKTARKIRLKKLSEKRLKEKRDVLKESNGNKTNDGVVQPGEAISYLIKRWRTEPPRSPEKRSSPKNKKSMKRLIWWKRGDNKNSDTISDERKEQVRSSLEKAVQIACGSSSSSQNDDKNEKEQVENKEKTEEISIEEIRRSLTLDEISVEEIRESLTSLNVDVQRSEEENRNHDTPASSLSSIEVAIDDEMIRSSIPSSRVSKTIQSEPVSSCYENKIDTSCYENKIDISTDSLKVIRNESEEQEQDISVRSSNSTIESYVSNEGGVSEMIMSRDVFTTNTKLDKETEQILREWKSIEGISSKLVNQRVRASERVHPLREIDEPSEMLVLSKPEENKDDNSQDDFNIENEMDEELLLADAEAFTAVRQLQSQLKVLREAFGKCVEEEEEEPSTTSETKVWTMPSKVASESLENFDKWFRESGVKGGLFERKPEEAPETLVPDDDHNDIEKIMEFSVAPKRFDVVLWTRTLIQTMDVPCKMRNIIDRREVKESEEKDEEEEEKLVELAKERVEEKPKEESLFLPDLDDDDDVLLGDDDDVLLDDDELRYSTESLESEIMPMNLSTSRRERKHDERIAQARERRDRALRDQAKYAAAIKSVRNSSSSESGGENDTQQLQQQRSTNTTNLEQHPLYSPPCVVRNVTKLNEIKNDAEEEQEITPRRKMFDRAWEEHDRSNQFDSAWKSIDTPSPTPQYPEIGHRDSKPKRRRSALAVSEIQRRTTFDEAWSPRPSEESTKNIDEKEEDPIVSALEKIIVEYEAALNARRDKGE